MEKPTFKQKVDSFCTFLYNGETGQLLGRGGKSWLEIGVFYLIYYIILSGFFAATIAVFYQTVDENRPKLQDDSSLLKGNPGLGYKPMPDIETTLVHIVSGNEEGAKESIDKILNGYDDQKKNVVCPPGEKPRVDETSACKFDVQPLKTFCDEADFYGHGKSAKPCVLLKLNKIFGWIPDIDDKQPEGLTVAKGNYTADKIWISCEGENPADKQNLGKVSYSPEQGFPLSFYPYKKQDNYVAPLVMVKFENPMKRVGLMVRCTAFAKNILVDSTEKQGSVNFELLIDHKE